MSEKQAMRTTVVGISIIKKGLKLVRLRQLIIAVSLCIGAYSSYAHTQIPLQSQFKNVDLELRAKIAQKLFVDLRYYCTPKVSGYCQQALTVLPAELSTMLAKSKVGGVILFSENLSSKEQIVRLNHDLQLALMPPDMKVTLQGAQTNTTGSAQRAQLSYIPLYIGIDQEGGRISRLPQHEFLGFAGNMAIGASAKVHKNTFATDVAMATAQQLTLLGINVNFAPVIDVNNNPDNPIINVRAYGQSPKLVADLGGAAITAMQSQNISVAAKHFPGHGDTFIDSHVGLPSVSHSRDVINKVDLFPFRSVISDSKTRPDMIMTAHIQYPALDNTRFVSNTSQALLVDNTGAEVPPVLPATLSRKILTGILRDEYAYNGLIVTDALNMKSITQYLTPIEAVIQSFRAGADITLMPYHISSPEDAIGFLDWLNELTIFISQDNELKALVDASYNRIVTHKGKRGIAKRALMGLDEKLTLLAQSNYRAKNEALAMSLSQASFTQIKGMHQSLANAQNVLGVMPDKLRCEAFTHYWKIQQNLGTVQCISILSQEISTDDVALENINAIVVGDATPRLAWYESTEFENIHPSERLDDASQQQALLLMLQKAIENDIPRVLVKLRSPYVSVTELGLYDGIFASYDYQVAYQPSTPFLENSGDNHEMVSIKPVALIFSPAFASLAKVLTGEQEAQGTLPVILLPEVVNMLPELSKSRQTKATAQ